MPQPAEYVRQYDFSDYQDSFPGTPLPGNQVDNEYDNIKTTLDQIRVNLELLQKDDGSVKNAIIGLDQLTTDVAAVLSASGTQVQGDWTATTAYVIGDLVEAPDGATYIATTNHTSTADFVVDRDTSGYWFLFANPVRYLGTPLFNAFDGTGAQTDFTLSQAVQNEQQILVYVDGSFQDYDNFTVSGTTLTFTSAPPSGTRNVLVIGLDNNALSALNAAVTAQNATAVSEANALASEVASAISAGNALASEGAAALAETASQTAQGLAETAQTASEAAQTAAELAETNAAASETAAGVSAGNASTSAGTATTQAGLAATARAGAEAAETAAGLSATNASASAGAASTSASNASTSASNALASEVAAGISETAAAASAASVASALESVPLNDITVISNADSPYSLTQAQNGHFISVDTSAGPVVISIAATLTDPFNVRVKKETGDANAITLNLNATEEFTDGTTTKDITGVGGYDLVLDTDTSPDTWKFNAFGASAAANKIVNSFVDGVDYTSGTTTVLTLSSDPGSSNNIVVTFDGVTQHHSEYGLTGTTLTFTAAIPLGVDDVEVQFGTALAVGVPADDSVGYAQMASSFRASVADAQNGTANQAYMTPLRTAQAIAALGGVTITDSVVATPVANTTITIANPLGEIVKYAKVMYRAKVATWGMTIGQEFDCSLNEAGSTYYGFTLDTSDVANFKLYASSLGAIRAPDNTNRLITAANFDIFVRCIT